MSDALPAVQPDEARLAAEIDRLKVEFPRTRELYREVCALLFLGYSYLSCNFWRLVSKNYYLSTTW